MFQHREYVARDLVLWKDFVRESRNDVNEIPFERKVYQLGLKGDEARAIYEEIINENVKSDSQFVKCKNQKSRTGVVNKKIATKNQPSANPVPKVTINTILRAVEEGNLNFLSKNVTSENVNMMDDFGWTPLMAAAYCGRLNVVELLLTRDANIRIKEKSGLTAAQLALKKNYLSIVALLKRKTERTSNEHPKNANTILSRNQDAENLSDRIESSKNYCSTKKDVPRGSKGFYCNVCNAVFYDSSLKKHESSTLHIFNTKPKLTYVMYGITKQNKGYQMLLNTGWDDQRGLGPSGKGIQYPIKTCLKTDRKGLGQPGEKDYRVTHFKAGDARAINNPKISEQKYFKKKDREKLMNREARRERAIRIALS